MRLQAPLSRLFTLLEELFGGALLFVAVLLVLAQIALRELRIGASGLYEIATFCFVWSVLLTAANGVRRNAHVRVDLLLNIVPARIAHALEVMITLLMLIVALFLTASGYLLIEESWILGDRTLGTVSIPMWIPQLAMPLGGALIIVVCVARLRGLTRGAQAKSQLSDDLFQI